MKLKNLTSRVKQKLKNHIKIRERKKKKTHTSFKSYAFVLGLTVLFVIVYCSIISWSSITVFNSSDAEFIGI